MPSGIGLFWRMHGIMKKLRSGLFMAMLAAEVTVREFEEYFRGDNIQNTDLKRLE